MAHANYFRRQAEVLVNLSRATIDLVVAGRLRALAAEFLAKADEVKDKTAEFPPLPVQRVRPSTGEMDRS